MFTEPRRSVPAALRVLSAIGLLALPTRLDAGAWTLPKGHVWLKLAYLAQSTSEEYVSTGVSGREPDLSRVYAPGERAPYDQNGRYRSHALFLDAWYGVTDRVDIGAQVPWFRQQFENDALLIGFGEPRVSSGISDIRVWTKVGLIRAPLVASLKVGVKAPTGDFENEEGIIPVGEAQWDLDIVGQMGKSFWPLPVYANLDVGYRFRFRNADLDRDPGNELLFLAEVGAGPFRRTRAAFKLEATYGKRGRILGVPNESTINRITYLSPSVSIDLLPELSLEASVRFSLNGRSYPAGAVYSFGLTYAGNLPAGGG